MSGEGLTVLMISLDTRLGDSGPNGIEARERHLNYARLLGRLTILVVGAGSGRSFESGALDVVVVRGPRLVRAVLGVFLGVRLARERRSDVVISQDARGTGLIALLVGTILSIPFLIQVHEDPAGWVSTWMQRIIARFRLWLLRRAAGVRVVSLRAKRWLADRAVSAEAIPISTSTGASGCPEANDPSRRWDICLVSRLVPEKNVLFFAEVVGELVKTRPGLSIVVVGNGPQLGDLVRRFGSMPGQFDWVMAGALPHSEALNMIRCSRVLLLPSLREGWALVAIEAAMVGTPVVMAPTGCAEEVIVTGESGVIIPMDEAAVVARAVADLLDHPELRDRLVAAARRAACRLPSRTEAAEALTEWIRRCWGQNAQISRRR